MVWDLRDTMMAMSLEPGAMRRQRLLETRKLAVNIEKHKQQEYRDAVVLSVEKEVAIRRVRRTLTVRRLLSLDRLCFAFAGEMGRRQSPSVASTTKVVRTEPSDDWLWPKSCCPRVGC